MTSIKMTIQGELALVESALSELRVDEFGSSDEYRNMKDTLQKKLTENQDLMKIVHERCSLELE
jgi:hypothetical protein